MVDLSKIFDVVDVIADKDKGYRTNKRRAAVVAYEGFNLADFVRDNRFSIHLTASTLCVVCGGIGWIRREHGAEALALWFSLSGLFGCVAWYTRAGEAAIDSEGKPVESDTTKAANKVVAMLDKKAAELDKVDPGWDERTIRRVLG